MKAEVRELVRGRGHDPAVHGPAMRQLIDEVVLDYVERALSSAMPTLPDPGQAARVVCDAVAGFGRCSAISTILTSRGSGSTNQGRVVAAAPGF